MRGGKWLPQPPSCSYTYTHQPHACLLAANKLCGEPATDKQLIEWGADLGSDVSFFLSLGTAYCTGAISPPPRPCSQPRRLRPRPLGGGGVLPEDSPIAP